MTTVPKAKKTTSYFDTTDTSTPHASSEEENSSFFPSKYDYKEDWGEKYTGVSELGLYILNIESGQVIRVPDVAVDVTIGQPIFTPCGRWGYGQLHNSTQ